MSESRNLTSSQVKKRLGERGFSLVELLVTTAIIGILASLVLASVAKAKPKAKQALCLSNLRQAGMAFQMFANDHNNRLPTEVSTNFGGALEYCPPDLAVADVHQVFASLSNELSHPTVLLCPSDTGRSPAQNFARFGKTNVSYFAGLQGTMLQPISVLAGDRNVTLSGSGLRWTAGIHERRGDLLFADGHVEKRITWELPLAGFSTNVTTTTTTTGDNGGPSPTESPRRVPGGLDAGEGNGPAAPPAAKTPPPPRFPGATSKKRPPTAAAIAPAKPELPQSSDVSVEVKNTEKTALSPAGPTSAPGAQQEEPDGPIVRFAQLAILASSCFSLLLALVILLMMLLKKLRERRLKLGNDSD